MKMMIQFIKKIQNSDEKTKKTWLIILSSAAMSITLALWVTYMNLAVTAVAPPAEEIGREQKTANQANFVDILGAGISKIAAQIKDKLSAKKDIIINKPEINFQVEELEKIEKTSLR